MADADQTYREVMTKEPPEASTPFEVASRELRLRTGLAPFRAESKGSPLGDAHVRGRGRLAMAHRGSRVRRPQQRRHHARGDARVHPAVRRVLRLAEGGALRRNDPASVEPHQRERGRPAEPWPMLSNDALGYEEFDKRLFRGAQEFADVNLMPAPRPLSPYRHAGILNFVFGHVWQRPGLSRRERRIITVAACAVDDSPTPLRTHVAAAIHSGDVTRDEMDEIILQFSAYYGFPKGEALRGRRRRGVRGDAGHRPRRLAPPSRGHPMGRVAGDAGQDLGADEVTAALASFPGR